MALTAKDLERLQAHLPDYPTELIGGEIIVMSPSGLESDEIAIEICAQLRNWVKPRRLGRVLGSSAGFVLPNTDEDVRAPDASFIRAERMPQPTESYAQLVPDLVFEVKSKTDSLEKLRQKIQEFIRLGAQVGVLVDPRTQTMEVYRLGVERVEDAQILRNGEFLTVPELLPGWELSVSEVWAPVFE
ncbi:MAG: Uma2 family endonuclease [Oculatellaceae cyanobacterium bins.114]|nr:Uma2 family endonuclease [Oculatellaceae cyanobacterium bins.114]